MSENNTKMKKLDLSKNVYELTEEYPELIEILFEIGFKAIKNPIARRTIGRVMTIQKGCEQQDRDLGEVIKKLRENGFDVVGELKEQ